MNTGETITIVENIPVLGKLVVSETTKTPLVQDGLIIGVLGICVDITDRKERERLEAEGAATKALVLQLEKEALQTALAEQEKFKKVVAQMMHDITSPVSSIDTIVRQVSSNLPENDRVTLRNAAGRIAGIAHNLMNKYKNTDVVDEDGETTLVSLAVLQIINEKQYEHRDKPVIFDTSIKEISNFRFIKINAAMFKRMISNLVNNSVDAIANQKNQFPSEQAYGKITITLGDNGETLLLVIKDNGPGMPEHIKEKFKAGIEVAEGKGDKGHGIGLAQVRDTIINAGGTIDIHSTSGAGLNTGTRIIITFPIIPSPAWLASEIKLTKDDTVVILDDDESIHGAWDSKFKVVLEKVPELKVKHYRQGIDAIDYIKALTEEQQQNIFLLTDRELLDQDVDGLDVVAQTNMKRAILVTSYAIQAEIQEAVIKAGIKFLPKELAHAVTITVDKKIQKWSKKVDMVWAEDQAWLLDDLVNRYYSNLQVDKYYDPISLMEDIHQYTLDTRIILDTYYETSDHIPYTKDGFQLAKELHDLGYTKLILYAGEEPMYVPEYLQVVLKTDRDATAKLDKI